MCTVGRPSSDSSTRKSCSTEVSGPQRAKGSSSRTLISRTGGGAAGRRTAGRCPPRPVVRAFVGAATRGAVRLLTAVVPAFRAAGATTVARLAARVGVAAFRGSVCARFAAGRGAFLGATAALARAGRVSFAGFGAGFATGFVATRAGWRVADFAGITFVRVAFAGAVLAADVRAVFAAGLAAPACAFVGAPAARGGSTFTTFATFARGATTGVAAPAFGAAGTTGCASRTAGTALAFLAEGFGAGVSTGATAGAAGAATAVLAVRFDAFTTSVGVAVVARPTRPMGAGPAVAATGAGAGAGVWTTSAGPFCRRRAACAGAIDGRAPAPPRASPARTGCVPVRATSAAGRDRATSTGVSTADSAARAAAPRLPRADAAFPLTGCWDSRTCSTTCSGRGDGGVAISGLCFETATRAPAFRSVARTVVARTRRITESAGQCNGDGPLRTRPRGAHKSLQVNDFRGPPRGARSADRAAPSVPRFWRASCTPRRG